MRYRPQMVFDAMHIKCVEAPIVIAEIVKAGQSISFNTPGHINVRFEVAPNQLAQTSKQRFASMQADVARARNRTPKTVFLENKKNVVKQIYPLDIQQQGSITILFEDHCSGH